MDVLNFSGLPIPPEARAAMGRIQDPALWLLENKARSYNQQLAPPDGSGVECARCGNKGSVAVVDADGPRLVVRRGLPGEYMLWGPALREIKGEQPERGAAILARYRDAPLLYVDDLFKGRADLPVSDWDLRLAFELLDHRYSNRLPTILSTERSFPELVRMDEAIAGRLRERSGKYLINISPEPEKNYRFRGRENEK